MFIGLVLPITLSDFSLVSPVVPSESLLLSPPLPIFSPTHWNVGFSSIIHSPHKGTIIITKCPRWKIFLSKLTPTGSLFTVVKIVNCLIAPEGPKPFPHSTRWGSYAAKPSYFHVSSKNSQPPWSCQIYSSLQEKVTHKATTQHGCMSDCISLTFSCVHSLPKIIHPSRTCSLRKVT